MHDRFPLSGSSITAAQKYIAIVFIMIALLLFAVNAFPSLYGDEYGSLHESQALGANMHAITYFLSLYLWSFISQQDWFLRIPSLLWFGAGLYWLDQWLRTEKISDSTRKLVLWLAVLNPFLWMHGFQIRFYATFFATSILFAWCYRAWQANPSASHARYVFASAFLLLTSHLFGLLVIGTMLLNSLWEKLSGDKKRWLVIALTAAAAVVFIPSVRSLLVEGVLRITNATANSGAMRGIGLGMLAKVPFTFYFFVLGERVHPLWWWVTFPAMLVAGAVFLMGIWRLRKYPSLGSLSIFMLLNIPLMFLVIDPLAPSGLQGAAPRYLIFVVPYFLLIIVFGTETWKPWIPAVALVSLVGMYALAVPAWSYGGSDLVNWPQLLADAVRAPEQTCMITDGRAGAPVSRYVASGTKVAHDESGCSGFQRIVLVSNDYRLSQVRYFDEIAGRLGLEYELVSNRTWFPAQVTVYDKAAAVSSSVAPSRLDLPEQDLRFPLRVPRTGWHIQGFVRLDEETSERQVSLSPADAGKLWVLTNYRATTHLTRGTPVFRLHFKAGPGNEDLEIMLRSEMETAAWDGNCVSCISLYEWTKMLHLLGDASYPAAYRHYSAHIWGFPLKDVKLAEKFTLISVTYLLDEGTGYFFGIFSEVD